MNNTLGNMVYRSWPQLLISATLVLSITGCAGKPPVALSSRQMEAIRHNQRGIKAEAKGESPQALEEFSEALRINNSIENTEGIIVALVNSSRVHRHNNDAKAALAMINKAIPLVTPQTPLYPEVAFEMAQVKLLSGNLNEAATWATRAVAGESGAKQGMRINLLARILYLQGNLPEAEIKVREALRLNREHELREEEANSLRTLADIQASGKRSTEARESYNQALAIDKVLGKSRKIATDLRGLALLSQSHNDPDQALNFYQRAFAVSSSDGDRVGAADDLLKMARIHESRGEKDQSERLLAERENLLKNPVTP